MLIASSDVDVVAMAGSNVLISAIPGNGNVRFCLSADAFVPAAGPEAPPQALNITAITTNKVVKIAATDFLDVLIKNFSLLCEGIMINNCGFPLCAKCDRCFWQRYIYSGDLLQINCYSPFHLLRWM